MVSIKNVTRIKKQIRQYKAGTTRRVEAGLVKAGRYVQRESQMIVPVDTGNLRAGADTRKRGSGLRTIVHVVYVAAYAIFVHENLFARHKPGKEARFLFNAVKRNLKRINQIFRDTVNR
jgi:hypothetical protein